MKKKIISKFSPGLISLLLMAQGACVPRKTPISLSAKPAVTQRAPQDFIYPKIQITNTKGEIKIIQARPLTAEEENMPEPAPFSIKKISHAEMVYGQYVGKDYGDAMAVDVYVEQGTTSQIRSKILGNTCGVNWVMTYVEDPFTATDNYMYGGQRKRISTYISNIDTLKNSSWTYRIEDVLDSSVAYDFPVTLYNGSDAYCGGTPSPSPSPSPSSNPSPTPSPSPSPTPTSTPSPFPSVPTGDGLCESPQVANDVNTLANQLAPLVREASQITGQEIPFDVPNGGDFRTQFIDGFSVALTVGAVETAYNTSKTLLEEGRATAEQNIQTANSQLATAEQQKATLLERRQNVHQTKMDRDVKNAIIQDIKEQLNQLSPQIQELQNALRTLEATLMATERVLDKMYAFEDSILETANKVVSCVTNGNGNGGDNGNGGGNGGGNPSSEQPPFNTEKLISCIEVAEGEARTRQAAATDEDLKSDWQKQAIQMEKSAAKLRSNPDDFQTFATERGHFVELKYALETSNVIRIGAKKNIRIPDGSIVKVPNTDIDVITGNDSGLPELLIQVKAGQLKKFAKDGNQAKKTFEMAVNIQNKNPNVRVKFAYDQERATPHELKYLVEKLTNAAKDAKYQHFNPEQDMHTYQSVLPNISQDCFY